MTPNSRLSFMDRSILFLTNAYPDFDCSYRGVFVKDMALHLIESGLKVSIVTPKIYRDSPCYEKQEGIVIYRFPFFARGRLLIEYKKIPYFRMILYYMTGCIFTLYAMLRHHCNLIHVHWAIPPGPIGLIIGKLFRKAFIVTVHGSDFRIAVEGSQLLKNIFASVCRKATHIHLVSRMMEEEIRQIGIPESKISIWPMGVDEAFLQSGKDRRQKPHESPVTVLSNRNLLPIYNISCLIRAIPLVLKEEPEVRFFIAGDGPERMTLEREVQAIAKSGDAVPLIKFLGRIPHQEMPHILAQTDVYVSTALSDGTSISLLEAIAAGAFPIVSDISANRDWISHGVNGFLFSAGDEVGLAARIIDAVRNRDLLEESAKKNHEMIREKAYWKTNILKITRVYENV